MSLKVLPAFSKVNPLKSVFPCRYKHVFCLEHLLALYAPA